MARSFFSSFSVSSIVSAILSQVGGVVRRELEIAKREFVGKVKALFAGGVLVAIGMSLSMSALILFIIAGVSALTLIWPLWLSALVGGGSLLVIALIFLAIGASKIKKNMDLRPERAISALKRFSHEID
ncbi:MAG TPA: phage holin family protein [Demequinaceae bacterium]